MNDPIEQLRKLVEARAKATAGPWTTDRPQPIPDGPANGFADRVAVAFVARGQGVYAVGANGVFPASDQAFIALAGSLDLQAILSAWERDREELEKLRKPTMWWDEAYPEMNCSSPDEWYENGYADPLNHGDVVSFMTARGLPNRYYRLEIDPSGEDGRLVEITKDEYTTITKGTQ